MGVITPEDEDCVGIGGSQGIKERPVHLMIGEEEPGVTMAFLGTGGFVHSESVVHPTLQEFPTCRPVCPWTGTFRCIHEGNGGGGHFVGNL